MTTRGKRRPAAPAKGYVDVPLVGLEYAPAAEPPPPVPVAKAVTERAVLNARGYLLGATKARESAEEAMAEAVAKARAAGMSWDAIGAATRTQGETVRRRHG